MLQAQMNVHHTHPNEGIEQGTLPPCLGGGPCSAVIHWDQIPAKCMLPHFCLISSFCNEKRNLQNVGIKKKRFSEKINWREKENAFFHLKAIAV